jgi:methionyl-tRNA formyltransferase
VKLCIAGKNQIAVEVLEACAPGYDLVCLPNPDDQGEDGWQPSLKRAARKLGVPVVEIDDLYPVKDLCFLSLEYSRIVRPERFATDKLFNLHFSLLPHYRGCFTSIWPLLNGEREHGVTLHCIDAGIDTGPVIARRAFSLDGMTAFDVYMACQREGVRLALDWIDRLVEGQFEAHPQGEGTTYPRKALDFGLRELDLTQTTEEILRRFRAFSFPVYQRPTLRGRDVEAAEAGAVSGWSVFDTADGQVSLRFLGSDPG